MNPPTSKRRVQRLSIQQIERFLDGEVRPVRTSFFYLIGMSIVTVTMVLLPLIYLGIVAGAGYAVYYHAVHNLDMVHGHAIGLRGRLLVYVAPLVAGVILVLFMLKPLLARHRRREISVVLQKNQEPILFAFVERLCNTLGAPMPCEISLDCDVNASASFRRGFRSLLGSDLTLTIGLPLVAGMTLRQFSGVLAHEFGHFTQRIGMRLSYIINRINGWFYRVVYERDNWDEWLVARSQDGGWLSVVWLLTRLCVWLTRRALWLLMMIAHGISCFALRQMEYDADSFEAQVAGTETFVSTFEKLHLLSLASTGAYAQLESTWRDRRLADNLPVLIAAKTRQVPKEILEEVKTQLQNKRTGFFDSHPTDRDRIKRAMKKPTAGILHGDCPAYLLLSQFDVVCKTASLLFYRQVLGPRVQRENLVSVKQLVSEDAREQAESTAVEVYLGHAIPEARVMLMQETDVATAKTAVELLNILKQSYEKIVRLRAKATVIYSQLEKAEETLLSMTMASALCRAGVKFDAKEFELKRAGSEHVALKKREASASRRESITELDDYEHLVWKRMLSALLLLRVPAVANKVDAAAHKIKECTLLLSVLKSLDPALRGLPEMRHDQVVVCLAGEILAADPDQDTLRSMLHNHSGNLHEYICDTRLDLENITYPFRHSHGQVSIARYLLEHVPSEKDVGGVVEAFESLHENLWALYIRIMTRLAYIALQAEKVLGVGRQKANE